MSKFPKPHHYLTYGLIGIVMLNLLLSAPTFPKDSFEYAFLSTQQWETLSGSADWAAPRYSPDSSQVCVKLKFGTLNRELFTLLNDAGVDTVQAVKTHSQALTVTQQWEVVE
ncbi:hypothetical protein K8I28_15935 [bacterium]|nr:hypothetical protein [bacterium]